MFYGSLLLLFFLFFSQIIIRWPVGLFFSVHIRLFHSDRLKFTLKRGRAFNVRFAARNCVIPIIFTIFVRLRMQRDGKPNQDGGSYN